MAKIWIDLDNTPHVPLFKPLVRELDRRGHAVVLTARNAFQVCELATRSGMKYTQIGKHYGKNSVMKVWGLGWRSVELFPFVRRERPGIGLSHGSRSQILLCNALRIPSVMMADYEHVQMPIFVRPRWEIVPAALSGTRLHATRENRILRYQGIKEDIYVPEFTPDAALRDRLGLQGASVVVTVRPPANEAHYHNPEAELLFAECVKRVCATPGAKAVPCREIESRGADQARGARMDQPRKGRHSLRSSDGLNLLWVPDTRRERWSTMNREAAAPGVPPLTACSAKTRRGRSRRLNEEGKLVLIEDMHDVETRFVVRPRDRANERSQRLNRGVLSEILDHIDRIVEQEGV